MVGKMERGRKKNNVIGKKNGRREERQEGENGEAKVQ
jgi:hypothetical protein